MLSGTEFKIIVHQEDTPVRGNAIASGDEDYDREVEDKILADLECNEWAWCCVEVKAEWKGLTASTYLGCCSYENEESFKCGGYFEDMRHETSQEIEEMAHDIANTLS